MIRYREILLFFRTYIPYYEVKNILTYGQGGYIRLPSPYPPLIKGPRLGGHQKVIADVLIIFIIMYNKVISDVLKDVQRKKYSRNEETYFNETSNKVSI